MDPNGKKLGRIVHGAPATTNLAFRGDDWKTLYFTSRNHLGAVNVKIPASRCRPRRTCGTLNATRGVWAVLGIKGQSRKFGYSCNQG